MGFINSSASLSLSVLPDPNLEIPWIYAYVNILRPGRHKVGMTKRTVKERISEQVNTGGMADVTKILFTAPAMRQDGSLFRDSDVHDVLKMLPGVKRIENVGGDEWFECTLEDVNGAYNSVFLNQRFSTPRDRKFPPRQEQLDAIEQTFSFFNKFESTETARYLWNAKMRFGKTFASYLLAKKMGANRILILTYKPAVQDSWEIDVKTHIEFDDWEFVSRDAWSPMESFGQNQKVVCFVSLQDLRNSRGRKADERRQSIYATEWELVIIDEYHFGAWNDATKELLAGESSNKELKFARAGVGENGATFSLAEALPGIKSRRLLCLSGTPFRAIATNDFGTEQIFNWTYTDEQRAKLQFQDNFPGKHNPYQSLPSMTMLVYELPQKLAQFARKGHRNEFDLNEFFAASGEGKQATFNHPDQVQGWLDWLRGQDLDAFEQLDDAMAKPFPYSNTKVLPYLTHSVWFLPNVAAVFAMKNLLESPQNRTYWVGNNQYTVKAVAGDVAGIGTEALPPVREAIGSGFGSKTITLTCGKLLTGVTVPQWSAIFMLSNVEAPETYFQAAFRVQSGWSTWNPDGNDPNFELVHKPTCLVVDFAPNRSLKLFAEYGARLGEGIDIEADIRNLAKFLPVLGFDGTGMKEHDVASIINAAFSATPEEVMKMGDSRFLNPDSSKLNSLSDATRLALARIQIRGTFQQGKITDETEVNETPAIGDLPKRHGAGDPDSAGGKDRDQEDEVDLAERLKFLSNQIKVFMYLSEIIEKNINEVLNTPEDGLFAQVMGVDIPTMRELVNAGLFNEPAMRMMIHYFRKADEEAAKGYLDRT